MHLLRHALPGALTLAALAAAPAAQVISADPDSGNIDTISPLGPDSYELTIRPDTGSTDQQWFYFTVSQAAGRTLTFELPSIDISAPFNAGMTPAVSRTPGDAGSWGRVDPTDTSFANWRLTFSYTFADDAPHHFAYSFVYPVARAAALVDEIAASPWADQRVLTQSLQGRDVDLLEITEGDAPDKMGIWIQARQHPAETGGSWSLEAFLQWLVGPSAEARALRRRAVVRAVPMVNPDGVALGNYRRNSLGLDLNREWDVTTPQTSPTVAAVLTELAAFDADVGLDMFLDLHNHSSELKNWVYGVDGDPAFDALERGWAEELGEVCPDFSYAESSFGAGNLGVAKNHVHTLYPQALAYTHEQTYHTIPYGPHADEPVTVQRYQAMGEAIGASVVSFFDMPVEPWIEIGAGLAGTHGQPWAVAYGDLTGGSAITFGLGAVREQSTAWFVFGLGQLGLPFKGGVLIPDLSPPGFFLGLPTGAQGELWIADVWPQGLPGGLELAVQWWISDPAGPVGFSASRGLVATTP